MDIRPLGDLALLVNVSSEDNERAVARVEQVTRALESARIPGVQELIPAIGSLGVMFRVDARISEVQRLVEEVLAGLPSEAPALTGQEREIPVCYGGEFGPDLSKLAQHAGLAASQAIQAHSRAQYRVLAIGFAPGFPYLGGLPENLHYPRRATPRLRVAAGSVAIGGRHTGIYPLETPGGWQIIGRTPRPLFEARAPKPAWLQRGDRVRFRPVSRSEYDELAGSMDEARRRALPQTEEPSGPPVIEVLRPGVQTTVQDLGRPGWQSQGVPVSGAVDTLALVMANLIVDNPPDAAVLEWARRGPVLRFLEERVVAVAGVEPESVPPRRPRLVRAGEVLDLTHAPRGMRGYLAISGGITVPMVLGSRSTCLAGQFGGFRGRALRAEDTLPVGEPTLTHVGTGWFAGLEWVRADPEVTIVRIVPGPQADRFASWTWRVLTESTFHVRAESDRMGLRLDGASLTIEEAGEMISAPVAAGGIQVPPDGRPIVLLADRQTLGGYPQIAYVISADLPKLAQIRPQGRVRFQEVSLEEAEHTRLTQQRDLAVLRVGLEAKAKAAEKAAGAKVAAARPVEDGKA